MACGLRFSALAFIGLSLAACTLAPVKQTGHISAEPLAEDTAIPQLIIESPVLPAPQQHSELESYTVAVQDVPVAELLFALARDAKINVDIHPGIQGKITLNAVKQTLPQILDRISKQIALRYEMAGDNLLISPDTPYLQNYKIDYVNLSRTSKSETSVATEISTTGGSIGGQAGSSGTGNKSNTVIESKSQNSFWSALVQNIESLLQKSGEVKAENKDAAASEFGTTDVIANPMSGIISVRARQNEHKQIQAFLDQVIHNALRQVLIEATILEVELNNRHQSGIDWSRIASNPGNGANFDVRLTDPALGSSPFFLAQYSNPVSDMGNIVAALRMLETFGDVKVLSSPKIMALNNQAALLKVVDEKVYFTVSREIKDATDNSPQREIFTSEIHTVPVGVIMSVTPRINENGSISMNVRPTITRITGYATDPAPRLASSSNGDTAFDNLIPEIQVREMESLLHVHSGNTIVLGGLMQDKTDKKENRIPLLGHIPYLGQLFRYRDDGVSKTELVIFLRPQIIQNASLQGDLKRFREFLSEQPSP